MNIPVLESLFHFIFGIISGGVDMSIVTYIEAFNNNELQTSIFRIYNNPTYFYCISYSRNICLAMILKIFLLYLKFYHTVKTIPEPTNYTKH